jgi:hypothetical protein
MLLLRQLRLNDQLVRTSSEHSAVQGLLSAQQAICPSVPPISWQFKKNRRRITITVLSISTCFAISHGPSAVFSLWELLIGYSVGL